MKISYATLIACGAVLAGPISPVHGQQSLRISEFMASNTRSRTVTNASMWDEDKSYEDWMEIHNGGTEAVNLYGWSLTDNPGNLRKWTFPRISIPAGERLVVWASGKNRTDPAGPLHANFKISSSGGYLALVQRDGVTANHEWAPSYPPQAPDVSYGYGGDGDRPAYFTTASKPTPGTANGEGVTAIPPLVLEVPENAPAPEPGPVNLPVTARIVPTQAAVTSVVLAWKKMFAADVTVPMTDDGMNGDATAGDGVYTGMITGVSLAAGEMLRWKVAAADAEGRTGQAPPNNVPSNSLYPNASAVYYGTVAQDPSLASSRIPVIHWFAQKTTAGDSATIERVAISYGGEFYDNVGVNIHGQSTQGFPKKSYNLNFPVDRNLLLEPGGKRVKDLKLLSSYADKTKSRNTLGYEMYREAGVAAHFAFPVRVQRNGQFFALADAVEDADESYLERAGLNPRGSLYKLYAALSSGLSAGESGYEKKTRTSEPASDLNALASGLSASGDSRLIFGYDNVDLPATINSLAALNLTSNRDTGHKNYYLFRDSDRSGEWSLLPWDVDLSFGHNWTSDFNYFNDDLKTNNDASPNGAPGSGNIFFRFGYFGAGYPSAISDMYLRRLATLRDKFMAASGTDDWINRRFQEMRELLDPEGADPSDADLDFAKWPAASWKLSGSPGSNSPYRLHTMGQEIPRVLDEYLTVRRRYLFTTLTILPPPQPALPALTFGAVEFNPGGLNSQDGEYFIITNPTTLAIDVSGWKVSGAVDFELPAGTVIPGMNRVTAADPDRNKLYVARDAAGFRGRTVSPKQREKRFVVSGYSGQLSARGESLELRTAAGDLITSTNWPATPTPSQNALRVSELHYAPLPPTAGEKLALPLVVTSDFEYIELLNTGSATLDLGGASLTEGVTYTIPAGTQLKAGERLVIAADPTAFNLRHFGVFALGPWDGRLNNGGERIQLLDPAGESVLDFSYAPEWFPAAENSGKSLVVTDPAAPPWEAWGESARWQVSSGAEGNPGNNGSLSGRTYGTWRMSLPEPGPTTVSDPGGDTDGDGLSDLMEYALALDPLSGAAELPEAFLMTVDGKPHAALRFRRQRNTDDLIWSAESSAISGQWSPAAMRTAEIAEDHGDGTETVTMMSAEPVSTRLFLRLRAGLRQE